MEPIQKKNMTLNEYQQMAGNTDHITDEQAKAGYYFLGLTGEAGEVADQNKKRIRDDNMAWTQERAEKVKKELGDTLWYVARLAWAMGWTLEEVAVTNIEKLALREANNKIHGEGSDR